MRFLPLLCLFACTEYRIDDGERVPPADPPDDLVDEQGEPPDWNTCSGGFLGLYYNLPALDPAVGPEAPATPTDPADVPAWWGDEVFTFSRFDPTLDFGNNWWPVDEGLEGDPAYFTGSWTAWLRVWDDTDVTMLLGAADDAWVIVDDEIVASVAGAPSLDPVLVSVSMDPGQYPVRVRYAHRKASAAGFRFRLLQGEASICYPEFPQARGAP